MVLRRNNALHAGDIDLSVRVHERDGRFTTGSVWDPLAVLVDQLRKRVSLNLGELAEIDLLDGKGRRWWFLEEVGDDGLERLVKEEVGGESERDKEHKDGKARENGVEEEEADKDLVDHVAFLERTADAETEHGSGEKESTDVLVKVNVSAVLVAGQRIQHTYHCQFIAIKIVAIVYCNNDNRTLFDPAARWTSQHTNLTLAAHDTTSATSTIQVTMTRDRRGTQRDERDDDWDEREECDHVAES
ncbi:4077_t:CDS:2, partial [Acaulospora colombiana]